MSETTDDGGPAFARPETEWSEMQDGMSLRAYLAAKAMDALISSDNRMWGGFGNPESVAENACRMADALISELRKAGAK